MGIKTGDVITSANLKTLVNNLITLYNNRTLWLSEMHTRYDEDTDSYVPDTLEHRSFYITSIPDGNGNLVNIDIEPGSPINKDNLGNLIRKVLVINDVGNLKDVFDPEAQYYGQPLKLFYNGSTTDLLTWSNTYKNKKGTDSDHGCRGACVGICTGGCHGQGKGRTGTSSGSRPGKGSYWTHTYPGATCSGCGVKCTLGCGKSCYIVCRLNESSGGTYACKGCGATCSSGCSGGCSGSCGGSCSGNCYGGCSGSCNNTCEGTCTSCSGTCGGNCKGCGSGCGTECAGECTGACQASCSGGCAVDCKNGCFGGAK